MVVGDVKIMGNLQKEVVVLNGFGLRERELIYVACSINRGMVIGVQMMLLRFLGVEYGWS